MLCKTFNEQNLVVLNGKMWEELVEDVLHIFRLGPRIIDYITVRLFGIIFINCFKSSPKLQ